MRFIKIQLLTVLLGTSIVGGAQSIELMPGKERMFTDVQWLSRFSEQSAWSLFSRTRATVDYEENTNVFSGAYLNYTTKVGLGLTVLGRIASADVGSDVGVHYFKASSDFMVYALGSVEMNLNSFSWFSIMRFRPELKGAWRLYSSLELFSNFDGSGHVASVQRLRLGADYQQVQFGLGLNLSGLGNDYSSKDTNPGVFIRKEF